MPANPRPSSRKAKSSDQLALFVDPVQARKGAPEETAVWQAVKVLRQAGRKVYRAGKTRHVVDGQRMSDEEVVLLAKTCQT